MRYVPREPGHGLISKGAAPAMPPAQTVLLTEEVPEEFESRPVTATVRPPLPSTLMTRMPRRSLWTICVPSGEKWPSVHGAPTSP